MNSPGRFGLFTTVIAGLTSSTFSQEYLTVQILEASCDTLHAQVSVFFPFGAGNTCPPLSGFAVLPGDATAFVSLYYDISGPWPQVGCTTTTTVAIPIPSGEVMVNLGTFNISEGDTSAMVSDTLLSVCMTGIADAGSPIAPRFNGDLLTWTDPGLLSNGRVDIITSSGQVIRTCIARAGSCWLGDLAPGVFIARWPNSGKPTALRFARP